MKDEIYQPSPQGERLVVNGAHVNVEYAGDVLYMPVGKSRWQFFEMHSYFGAIPLRQDLQPAVRVAREFYAQYDKWVAGGKIVSGDKCVVSELPL